MASFPDMLEEDRQRVGFTLAQVAWRIGITPAVYRELEAGPRWPSADAYHAISALFGWPETFVGRRCQLIPSPFRREPLHALVDRARR